MVVVIKKNTPKAKLKALLKKSRKTKGKGFDARKHLGKLKFGEDGLAVQKRLRDEWA